MKIISWNVNGIRSAHKKGFLDFLKSEDADIYCFQEIKANKEDLPQELLDLEGYHAVFNSAEKKGYSGLAIYSKEKPISMSNKLDLERFDSEGRILELEYSDFDLMNIYIPHGGRQKENLDYKLDTYEKILQRLKKKRGNVILVGDFNVAHTDKDLARPSQNKDNIMFTPEEKQQIDELHKLGFVDSFRLLNQEEGNYSWWPYAFNARERNLGWRIDYAFVPESLSGNIRKAAIYTKTLGSDHCPIGLELEMW